MSSGAFHILTKARNGTVSIMRGLTHDECRQIWERLDPWYGMIMRSYEIGADGVEYYSPHEGCGRTSRDGDIELREVFGPEGWDPGETRTWDTWPKSETVGITDPRHPVNRSAEVKLGWFLTRKRSPA